MAVEWFLVNDGKELGPFTVKQIKELADSGSLQPNQLLRRSDKSKTIAARKVAGLFTTSSPADQVAVKRPPPPSMQPPPLPATEPPPLPTTQLSPEFPSQSSAPTVPMSAARESRLNPNVTFLLGIWAGVGFCVAVFTFLAINGRLAPLVVWLEEAAKQKQSQSQESQQPGGPLTPTEDPAETTETAAKVEDSGTSSTVKYDSGYDDSSVRAVMLADDFMLPPKDAVVLNDERLTADYFPHAVGDFMVYVALNYVVNAPSLVFIRKHATEKPDGEIEFETRTFYFANKAGKLIDFKSLGGKGAETTDSHWVRVREGYVELDTTGLFKLQPPKPGRKALKLDATIGASWPLEGDFQESGQATVETIFEFDGRPCALIRERTTSSPLGHLQHGERITWYLKGVGPIREAYSHDGFGRGMAPIARTIMQLRRD